MLAMPQSHDPSPQERAALLAYERLFEEWRVASQAATDALEALWRETLQPTDGELRRRLAADAARLNVVARQLYEQVLAALRDQGD